MNVAPPTLPLTDVFALRELIVAGEVSPVEVVRASLERAESVDENLNVFVSVTAELALGAARHAEKTLLRGGNPGVLAGIPVTVKDNIDVEGLPTTHGSRILQGNIASEDSSSVARLRAAGACIIGKTTLPEFATKGVGDSPLTGITRNPWNRERTSGGSSAGGAVGVAAGIAPIALVTDGGGSTRLPASFCGVFGMKPQLGRIPYLPIGASPTMNHIGVISNHVKDARLILGVVSGGDERDPMSLPLPALKLESLSDEVRGLRIAFSPTLGFAKPKREIIDVVERAVAVFRDELGCTVETIDEIFSDPSAIWESAFLAGAGARLGPLIEQHRDLMDPAVVKQVSRGIGGQSLSEYLAKSSERNFLREQVRQFFEDFDLLITPTLPVTAFKVDQNAPDGYPAPEDDPLAWVYYLSAFNVTGNPAASIPCGFDGEGLPIGMQIVGASFMEAMVFRAAAAFEAARPWAHLRPPEF